MEPGDGKRKSLRPVTRWLVVPIAFAWLGFIVMAPFALADERFAFGGIIFGFLGGLIVAINDPKWMVTKEETAKVSKEMDRLDSETPPPSETTEVKIPTLANSLFLTGIASLLAWLVIWAMQQNTSDKGIFFFVAAFFIISMIRRTLRKAWSFYGSLAGMLVSGGLLVVVVRSSTEKSQDSQWLTWAVAVPFILIEAWDETRALKRQRS